MMTKLLKSILMATVLFSLWPMSVRAVDTGGLGPESTTEPNTQSDNNVTDYDVQKENAIKATVPTKNSNTSFFSSYKENYVLPYTRVLEDIEGRQDTEIKFQISIKQPLVELSGFQLIAAYTQKSFWQAYAKSESSPFRESNYNPELMIKSPLFHYWQADWFGIFGYEHESNGASLPLSRSWDRLYLRLLYSREWFQANYKLWYRIPEEKKKTPDDAQGDDNPDIHHYYGYSELMIDMHWGDLMLGLFGRLNLQEDKGAVQVQLSYPLPGNRIYWFLQYWNGYGESLIDYNRRLMRIGIGILATRNQF